MIPFFQRSRGDPWHRIGLASAFPDLSSNQPEDCSKITPSCKAFYIPSSNGSSSGDAPKEADIEAPGDLKDQVLVFQYKGKFHAVDHVSNKHTGVYQRISRLPPKKKQKKQMSLVATLWGGGIAIVFKTI